MAGSTGRTLFYLKDNGELVTKVLPQVKYRFTSIATLLRLLQIVQNVFMKMFRHFTHSLPVNEINTATTAETAKQIIVLAKK